MKDLLRDHIAEIALLIYVLFPLLKRLLKRSGDQPKQTGRAEQDQAKTRAGRKRGRMRRPRGRRAPPIAPSAAASPAPTKPIPEPPDLLGAARAEARRLSQEASRLLSRLVGTPLEDRLGPAVTDDLVDRIGALDRSLQGNPTLSTIAQETATLRGLDELLQSLLRILRERSLGQTNALAAADRAIDDCYAPLLEFCSARGLPLRTSRPVAVSAKWDRTIAPRLASTRVAPIRVPGDFGRSLWQWPALAAGVASDFYYSFRHLDEDLHDRLSLPHELRGPSSEQEIDQRWLRELFGPWLAELFADVVATVMLGPAYVESVRRAHRNPEAPQRTAAIFQSGGLIDERPPARMRLYVAARVLHHLGRHREADAMWARWEADHPDGGLYFLQVAGRWTGMLDETLQSVADGIVDGLVEQPWPELGGFSLLGIPSLAYLHPEHSEVERLIPLLARGAAVDADGRWVLAAAVLAASKQPTLHDSILEAALRSLSPKIAVIAAHEARSSRGGAIGDVLVASLRKPKEIREAVILGAALSPAARGRR